MKVHAGTWWGDVSLASLEIATERTSRKVLSSLTLGTAGILFLGPLGVLASLMAKNKTKVTFIATFRNGQQALASADSGEYARLSKALVNNANTVRQAEPAPKPQFDQAGKFAWNPARKLFEERAK
jgi:hypothetical protein